MKKFTSVVAVLAFALAGDSSANEVGMQPSAEVARVDGARGPYPVMQTAVMERRKVNGAGGDMFSEISIYSGGGDWPVGGLLYNLGMIAYHPFDGANVLYQCISKVTKPWNYFTSNDFNCEGHSKPTRRKVIGYIYSYQHPGTAPLYRCRQDFAGRSDHFDSTFENCEGYGSTVNEGILGYLWAY